jgi:hypothetical protein
MCLRGGPSAPGPRTQYHSRHSELARSRKRGAFQCLRKCCALAERVETRVRASGRHGAPANGRADRAGEKAGPNRLARRLFTSSGAAGGECELVGPPENQGAPSAGDVSDEGRRDDGDLESRQKERHEAAPEKHQDRQPGECHRFRFLAHRKKHPAGSGKKSGREPKEFRKLEVALPERLIESFRREAVPHPRLRAEPARPVGVVLQLAPQSADVDP